MQVYAIAVSAGSRGNVGKLCPQDMANPIKGPALKTVFSGFQALAVRRSVRSYLRMPNQPIEPSTRTQELYENIIQATPAPFPVEAPGLRQLLLHRAHR
jgi:hypothetical protein